MLHRLTRATVVVAAVLLAAALPGTAGALLDVEPTLGEVTAGLDEALSLEADQLVVTTLRSDGAVVEVHDLVTGTVEVSVTTLDPHDHDHDDSTSGGEDAEGTGATSVPTSVRCSNSGTYKFGTPIEDENGNVVDGYHWKVREEFRFNPDGAPVSWWKPELRAAFDVWRTGANPCGLPDRVGLWPFLEGADSNTPVDPVARGCPGILDDEGNLHPDNENTIGWTDLGGSNAGITLGRGCTWITHGHGGMIIEADMLLNDNPDAVWCQGTCPGGSDGYDLRSLAAHEWGHLFGLAHPCSNAADSTNPCDTDDEEAAVMYPFINQNDTQNRTLSLADIEAAEILYPAEWAFEVVDVALDNPGPDAKLVPGESYTATVDLKNTGSRQWSVDASTQLATDPAGRCSDYVSADWASCSEASALDADLTDHNHSRVPNDETIVINDEVGRFEMTFDIPASAEGTTVDELFRPEIDGSVRAEGDPASVTLDTGQWGYSLDSAVLDNDAPGEKLAPGRDYGATVDITNTGDLGWEVGTDGRIKLDTDPTGRTSDFQGLDWVSSTRASHLDDNVSDPGAARVEPGETGRFTFTFSVDPAQPEGLSVEDFRPAVDDGDTIFRTLAGDPASFDVDVGGYAGQLAAQDGPDFHLGDLVVDDTIVQTQQSQAWVEVTNTGTAPWFVDEDFVTLQTAAGCSDFQGSDWDGCSVVGGIDDNAGDPGKAWVGHNETARFDFNMSSPFDLNLLGFQAENLEVDVLGLQRFAPATFDFLVL